jgi:hypothetical protein
MVGVLEPMSFNSAEEYTEWVTQQQLRSKRTTPP